MAQSKNNIITHGLSGKVGDIIVFSQRNGKTIVSKAPVRTAEASTEQTAHRQKFQQAVLYAKSALQVQETKELYEQEAVKHKELTPYNIAVADLFHAPKIEKIDLSNYKGKKGDTIIIKATDDFMVASVKVIINNPDGSLVEEGFAKNTGADWTYKATVDNTDLSGDKITIQATDLPDNLTEETRII